MLIIIPVPEAGHWEIEEIMIFDTCIYCGAERKKESLGEFKVGKKYRKCHTAECDCIEYIDIYKAIEEQGILDLLTEKNIDHGQSI